MCWPRQTKSPRLSIINFEKVKVKRLILKSESENMFLYHTSCASPTHNIPHHCCQKLILDLILIDVCMQQNVFPNHAGILCFGLRICIIFVLFFCMCIYICIQLLQYCHYQHLFHLDLSSSLHRSLHIFSHLQHVSRQMSKKLKNGNIK